MKENYDVIVVGAGPAGIMTCYELYLKNPELEVLLIDKGHDVMNRHCPIKDKKIKQCPVHKDREPGCIPACSITDGFGGAGAYSDGKFNITSEFGGWLTDYLSNDEVEDVIHYVDNLYLKHGATKEITDPTTDKVKEIEHRGYAVGLKLLRAKVRHLGTEEGYKIYSRLQEHLLNEGVDMIFDTMVKDIIIEDGVAKGVVTDKGETYTADGICRKYDIETQVGTVDVGVRVEVRDEIMEELNKSLYEAKLVYYTPTFDDKVRVFCSNPSGEVATEYYENGLAVVNGHAYKAEEYKTNNTNFALLVSKNFTKPFKEPIQYGKHIAQLSNMLCDGKILVQRFGDFVRGRRTTEERLVRNNITPTLKDAVPGDLSLVFPYRIMKDIEEMIYALDEVTPGMASDETLLYGVEVKFYSNKILTNKDFETNIKGLRAIGDGASVTRGLQQASANGLSVAKSILNK